MISMCRRNMKTILFRQFLTKLLNYITKAVSPYHAVKEGCNLLRQAGFQELDIQATWELQRGGAYFVRPFAVIITETTGYFKKNTFKLTKDKKNKE